MIAASEQSKRTMCIALFNRDLHQSNRCPGNYNVEYGHGWFYFRYGCQEMNKVQRPELTAEAEQKLREGYEVLYSDTFNTYLLGDRKDSDG